MSLFIFFFTLSVLFHNALSENPTKDDNNAGPRILNGLFAEPGQFPYVGFLTHARLTDDGRISDTYRINCAATIIHKRWAITAAHCCSPHPPKMFTVGTNEIISWQRQVLEINRTFIHPELYSHNPTKTWKNDAALLEMASDIKFDSLTRPIKIAWRTTYNENDYATYCGWGYVNENARLSSKLKYVKARIMTMVECKAAWWGNFTVLDSHHICLTNANHQASCPGDSGGPLVFGEHLIGVITHGSCDNTSSTIAHAVQILSPWIRRTLRIEGQVELFATYAEDVPEDYLSLMPWNEYPELVGSYDPHASRDRQNYHYVPNFNVYGIQRNNA